MASKIPLNYKINSDLELDASGAIKLSTEFEAKKTGVNLYLKINNGAIPFDYFGNLNLTYLFQSKDQASINDYISSTIYDISQIFSLQVINYDAILEEDKLTLKLYLASGQILNYGVQA